ncbi:MAG: PH domain-containing protein [Candidatus Woesebacteria bacterium]|jgi:hypothetical protein
MQDSSKQRKSNLFKKLVKGEDYKSKKIVLSDDEPKEEAVFALHEESVLAYPELHLSKDEYVIQSVKRHPIGVLSIWLFYVLMTVIVLAFLPFYSANKDSIDNALLITAPTAADLFLPALVVDGIFFLGAFIATIVYQRNRFYLTNESVIQHVSKSLFQNQEQIVNLVNVEDVSFEQKGIMQQLLSYGTLRLSTQGDETIYRFYFVTNPRVVTNAINDSVEMAMAKLEGNLRMHQIRE